MQQTLHPAANAIPFAFSSKYYRLGCRKPCPYLPPGKESRDAFKGKQLIVQTPKPGKLPSTFFEKEHPYIGKVRTNSQET